MSSSSVVLPAPFLPSTPTTSPGDTPKDRSCSTRFGPNILPRCDASMVELFICFLPLATQGFRELRFAQLQLPRGQHDLIDERIELFQTFVQRALASRGAPRRADNRHRFAA